ncbi:hypothetical protein K438DRAFT_1783874 [Mycena galopus ATCC 62051]|nr:hypothetical protein K438DRAFT_1783874 [Mycena galopus ATCC 62051]
MPFKVAHSSQAAKRIQVRQNLSDAIRSMQLRHHIVQPSHPARYVLLVDAPTASLLPPSSRPAARFFAALATANGVLLGERGQQQHRPPPHVSQVAPGDFCFPESILSELPSEPPFTTPTSWDDEPSSWLPHSAQQHSRIPTRWDEASGQPHWDDFASSIDLLMADFSDSRSNSRFTSAAPSSIPDDNDWSSQWSSSSSRHVSAAPLSMYEDIVEDRRIRWQGAVFVDILIHQLNAAVFAAS